MAKSNNLSDKYLKTSQALSYLGIGRNKLYDLIKEGKIKPLMIGIKKEGAKRGPDYRFTMKELDNAFK